MKWHKEDNCLTQNVDHATLQFIVNTRSMCQDKCLHRVDRDCRYVTNTTSTTIVISNCTHMLQGLSLYVLYTGGGAYQYNSSSGECELLTLATYDSRRTEVCSDDTQLWTKDWGKHSY